jgi:uncharacterized protein with NRDE domain
MCTLLVHVPETPGDSLFLGANRDEAYERPSEGPTFLSRGPVIWGGRDLEAGGTWLCARMDVPMRVAAVLNRPLLAGVDAHTTPWPSAARRSRGLLCLEAARAETMALAAEEARRQVQVFGSAPFNLFLAEAEEAHVVAYDGDSLRRRSLAPGWHALTHGDPDDLSDPRIAQALESVGDQPPSTELLRAVLSRNDGPGAACRHGERYGTVSSTVLEVIFPDKGLRGLHASGPPCSTPYSPGFVASFA